MAIQQLAEMNELTDSPSAALELYQFAVDQEDSDPQTWKVGWLIDREWLIVVLLGFPKGEEHEWFI